MLVFGSPVMAEDLKTDLQAVVSCIEQDTCKNILAENDYGKLGRQVVFVADGFRYALYWTGKKKFFSEPEEEVPAEHQGVTFWVRPNGTQGSEYILSFNDVGLDVSVDSAFYGENYQRPRCVSGLDLEFDDLPADPEKVACWQRELEGAIRAAAKTLLE
jgi:hypothetical protein